MPLRHSFFDDPLLRLTPPLELNDPFDSKPTKEGIGKKIKFLLDEASENGNSHTDTLNLKSIYEKDLRNGLNEFGVISLTEDPYNLVMWSHYAAQHKGIVISVRCNSSTFEYHDTLTEKCGISKKVPQRVTYTDRRPGFEMPEETIYEYFEQNFFSHFAMSKSNDWSYEKEHRYLIRLSEADVAIINARSDEWANIQTDDFKVTHLEDLKFKVEAKESSKRCLLPAFLALNGGARYVKDVTLYKRLSRNALVGVYFGCRVADHKIGQVRANIERSQYIEDSVKLYRGVVSQDRFEIDFQRLK